VDDAYLGGEPETLLVASLVVDRRTGAGRQPSLSMRRATPVYKTCHRSHVLFLPLLLIGPKIHGD